MRYFAFLMNIFQTRITIYFKSSYMEFYTQWCSVYEFGCNLEKR